MAEHCIMWIPYHSANMQQMFVDQNIGDLMCQELKELERIIAEREGGQATKRFFSNQIFWENIVSMGIDVWKPFKNKIGFSRSASKQHFLRNQISLPYFKVFPDEKVILALN